MRIALGSVSLDLADIPLTTWIVLVLIVLHLWMLTRAALRKEWGWFWFIFAFPLLGSFIYFVRGFFVSAT